MSTKNFPIASLLRGSGLALIAALAVSTTPASMAKAASAPVLSTAQQAASTDFSAARRRHYARRSAPRDAFGSIGGAYGGGYSTSQGFGYGVGDNSRNQTW